MTATVALKNKKLKPILGFAVCFCIFSCMLKFMEGTSLTLSWVTCNFFQFLHFSLFLMLLGHSQVTFPMSQIYFNNPCTFIVLFLHMNRFPVTEHCRFVSFNAFMLLIDQKKKRLHPWVADIRLDSTTMCLRLIVWFWFLLLCTYVCNSYLCFHVFAPGLQKEPTVCVEMLMNHFLRLSGGDWVDWWAPPWF